MSDYYPRMRNAAILVDQFQKFVNGILEHPRALEGVPRRLGTRSVKAVLKKLQKIEARREKCFAKISELNREEEDLLRYYKDDLFKIKKLVKAVYDGEKAVWEDFV